MIRMFSVATALLLAVIVTFTLFYIMQLAISSAMTPPVKGESIKIGDITIPEIEIEVQRVEPKPDEPEEPEEIPDLPEQDFQVDAPEGEGINIAKVAVDVGGLNNDASISASDSEMLPIVTMQPQYPNRALSRGIEGWCLVSFTVTETGTVVDPVVLDAEPKNIFDNASKRAVQRFKFNPRIVDGEAVPAHGIRYLFSFNLED